MIDFVPKREGVRWDEEEGMGIGSREGPSAPAPLTQTTPSLAFLKENIDVLRTLIKEHDKQAHTKTTPKKLTYGFDHVIDFLNGSYIKYALTINPTIYVSCIKQFWNTVIVKQSNNVTRLQALVDKKKVLITEAAIRNVLCLDDAEGVDCLPNEDIFAALARMGYEKPSTKLTFYKAFFSSQWKFLIYIILQSMSAKRTSWNEFSSAMASVVICLSTELTRRVGKGCSWVETPLFEGILVTVEPEEQDDADEEVQGNDNNAAQGADTVVSGDDVHDQSIPSPAPPTPPPQPAQDIPSTSQVQSPPPQPQSPTPAQSQSANFLISVFQEALDACAAFTRRVKALEQDKVTQDLEITKLKTRVKKLERANKERMIAELDRDTGVVLIDDKKTEKKAEDAQVEGRQAEIQAEIYQINMDHASKVLSIQEDKPEVQEAVDVVTTAKLIAKVVTASSTPVSASSTIILPAEPKVSAATTTATPVRVAVACTMRRKRVNTAGFRLDYFKGMYYDDIRPIFKAKFNSNIEFLLKSKEQIEEEENQAIESINETPAQKAAKRRKLNEEVKEATPLARKVHIVDYQIILLNNKPRYKIIRADGTYQLYVSFITLLKNCDREDLESLWSIVKERFSTSKPNNFSDDYLLTTLRAMFGRTDGQDQVWKSQRSVHSQAMVKSWKLLKSCGVHIISFTTTQLILLVERRYPLSKFTLDQMINAKNTKCFNVAGEELIAAKHKLMLLDTAAERRLILLSQDKTVNENFCC
uniref:Synaptobrevin, longin-like domain protein n=1 Tax=Tanacetum cinerariifolium TaxID=118510 RepID=A0A6L2K0Q4_TANCI|nr:hypothetical protein [Tanacetum cinerariifolium]